MTVTVSATAFPRSTMTSGATGAVRWSHAHLIRVVHRKGDASILEVVHIDLGWFATISRSINELDLSRSWRNKVRRAILHPCQCPAVVSGQTSNTYLVAKRVPANDNRLDPSWYWTGNFLEHNGLTEDGAAEDVADSAVRALPHFLELELLHACLVGCDGRAFDTDAVFLDGFCRLDRDFVVRLGETG